MPLNYLELQPEIRAYAQKAAAAHIKMEEQQVQLLEWLRQCAAASPEALRKSCQQQGSTRCALPAGEPVDRTFPSSKACDCILLAADGSQIVPSAHDAVPFALVNTSLICLDTSSSQPPQVKTNSEILDNFEQGVEFNLVSEDLIRIRRDLAELEVIRDFPLDQALPVIALRDGSLELFHQPKDDRENRELFAAFINAMKEIAARNYTLAGYIDRSQSTTITQMLTIFMTGQPVPAGQRPLPDTSLMELLLPSGQRSAIFELQSTSSVHYSDDLRLHFFYLNVSPTEKPAIVRVEIPAWVVRDPARVNQLQQVLLEQCRLMGSRPYPYVLHRAHETAVVHFDEKEQIQNMLQIELRKKGVEPLQVSNKLAAKELQSRTRM